MNLASEYRTSLRLTQLQHETIGSFCQVDGGRISMSTWIARAIDEKIQRDTQLAQDRPALNVRQGRRFYEFFAGGGMARAGLGDGWDCLFANDFDPMKGRAYRDNWGGGLDLMVEDINKLTTEQLPDQADLVWASFPCQDLSLAGVYKGIGREHDQQQTRSGTFWAFWRLMRSLMSEARAPKTIVLENVCGILTSNEGGDFSAVCSALSDLGYRFGALVIDARHFVPQSRPRVFIVGVHADVAIAPALLSPVPLDTWHPERMLKAYAGLSESAKNAWLWWRLPIPEARITTFAELIEEYPEGMSWDSDEKTAQLLAMMSTANLEKVRAAQQLGRRMVGGLYKRTRVDEQGNKIQRAEVRFDDLAGCLRTPAGGSSRQVILVVEGEAIRSRLLSPREAARLMGLDDTYKLPSRYNDAYHVVGDGVAVPVVRHLAQFILEPILSEVGGGVFHQAQQSA